MEETKEEMNTRLSLLMDELEKDCAGMNAQEKIAHLKNKIQKAKKEEERAMELTRQEARQIVDEDNIDWSNSVHEEILESTRWTCLVASIYKHHPTNKFYKFTFRRPATESQEEELFEYEDSNHIQVEKRQVTIERWVDCQEIELPPASKSKQKEKDNDDSNA